MLKQILLPVLALGAAAAAAPVELVPDAKGFPKGWRPYGKGPGVVRFYGSVLRVADESQTNEWGIQRDFATPAPGKYEFAIEVSGNLSLGQIVAVVNKKVSSCKFDTVETNKPIKYYLGVTVPEGCKSVRFLIYGMYQGIPDMKIHSLAFGPVAKFTKKTLSGKSGAVKPPEPIAKLKNLHLETPLKNAVIAPGNDPALKQAAEKLAAKFGAKVVDPASVKVPLDTHVIALGSRVNNAFLNHLYRRGFCYTDLVYPGKGGYELRSIHNPTGKGFNVILCGGSDAAGAVEAAKLLEAEPPVVGHLMKLKVPGFDKSKFDPYDPEHYYLVGKGGYYGWNYLSGMLALFYQTGDEFYAKEFLRLAFPDAKAKRDFQKFNPESIEIPNDPLAGPYHYCASQMMLLWDLVEEHPVFSDADRLKVTNGFVRQWKHHINWVRPVSKRLTTSSRHGQWSNISIYVLGRYFNRDYPAPVWQDAIDRAECDFANTNDPNGWIEGERGIIGWFVSGAINPTAQFSALTEMEYNPEGALANALKFMQLQWNGGDKSEIFGTAHRQALYLISEHTGDGKYIWFADLLKPYRKNTFRLGASFSPTGKIAKRPPTELLDTWTAAPMKLGEYAMFGLKEPRENCYLGIGWRDSLDETGDWVCFNCFNESYRTPFKLLSLSGLRLNGRLLLQGFGSYVQPTRGGTVSREIPTVGQIYGYGSAGKTAFMSGGVPKHAYSAWERSLMLRKRDFVLIADTITPAETGDDLTVNINFQTAAAASKLAGDPAAARIAATGKSGSLVRDMKISGKPECQITWGPRNTLFYTKKVGDRAVIEFPVAREVTCEPVLTLYDHSTRAGTVNICLDGKRILSGVTHYVADGELIAHNVPLGTVTLSPGDHRLEIEVASIHPSATDSYIGAGTFNLNAGQSTVESMYLTGSAGELVLRNAHDAVLKRRIKSDPKRPVTTFTLFRAAVPREKAVALTLDDRAALYRLPEPMLVFTGSSEEGAGTLVALESSGVAGTGVTAIGTSFLADAPVMLDWRFGKTLDVSGKPGTKCTVNGKPYTLDAKGVLKVSGLTPDDAEKLRNALKAHIPVETRKNAKAVEEDKCKLVELAKLPELPGFITPYKSGFLVGAGQELFVLDPQYRVKLRCKLNAQVMCAAATDDLYLAGCKDEELAAFDRTGKKVWSFTSVLAPSVEATQKYYWFKRSGGKPIYPGIFSLEVHDGKAFAGSACTMEIVDLADGKLIARLPQTWGVCRVISFLDQPDGSYNAVGLRNKGTDGTYMWAWNSKAKTNTASYRDTVPGYRNFPTFGSMYRTKAFVGDYDGGGRPELMADAQGMYTWLIVYRAGGAPAYQVNLGPGRIICDWTTGDFTGDKRPEAAVVTYTNELLAVDGKCAPLWNADIPFRAEMVAVDSVGKRIAAAGKDMLAVYDGKGKLLHVTWLPQKIDYLWCDGGKILVCCGPTISSVEF